MSDRVSHLSMLPKALFAWVVVAVLVSGLLQVPPARAHVPAVPTRLAASSPGPLHFIANLDGARREPRRAGFNLFDTGPNLRVIRALPRGVRAMVWLGEKCPTEADRSFRRTVRRLAGERRVFGYFLSDEPHLADCPDGPAALATRTRFIKDVSHGRQKSFIVLEHEDYHAFRPRVTHASLIGVDSYPCSVNGCVFGKIREKVKMARRAGIPVRKIVPVYQAFGQAYSGGYYVLPTVAQERRILRAWAAVVPDPVMDYTYGWRHQDSANPTLVDSPELQEVFRSQFAG